MFVNVFAQLNVIFISANESSLNDRPKKGGGQGGKR